MIKTFLAAAVAASIGMASISAVADVTDDQAVVLRGVASCAKLAMLAGWKDEAMSLLGRGLEYVEKNDISPWDAGFEFGYGTALATTAANGDDGPAKLYIKICMAQGQSS